VVRLHSTAPSSFTSNDSSHSRGVKILGHGVKTRPNRAIELKLRAHSPEGNMDLDTARSIELSPVCLNVSKAGPQHIDR